MAKWTAAQGLGPRQAKQFNEAIRHFEWKAKEELEITDYGQHCVTPMFPGTPNPAAAGLMLEIEEKYGLAVGPDNYRAIVADIEAATAKLNCPIVYAPGNHDMNTAASR